MINIKTNSKAFSLVELLIIIGIISILAIIILVVWGIGSKNKAAVASYKSSMKSVQTAIELCVGSGRTVVSPETGGNSICNPDNNSRYPTISSKCGASASTFIYTGPSTNWHITTQGDCRGCRLDCTVDGCQKIETNPGDCF